MTYNAFITRIKNVRKHPNADKLLIGECFGQKIVVGLDTKDEELGIYFPTDGKLSMEFMEANNLIGKKDEVTGERSGGYFDERGKVRTQKFRGEPSDGYFCNLSYLGYTGIDLASLQEGTPISNVNGHSICEKYVTQQTKEARTRVAKPREKTKYPCFHEHIDTEQLAYNIGNLKAGNVLVITEKVHGTSQRTGHTIELKYPKWGMIINGIFKREVIPPVKGYNYICGTRRVVLKNLENPNGFYGENEIFRKKAHEMLTPAHLREGVVVRVDGSRWYALKHKSFAFKVLEGIIKDADVADMEEAQDV